MVLRFVLSHIHIMNYLCYTIDMTYYYFITRSILLISFTVSLYIAYTTVYLHPCQRPQTYTVGTIDSSFNISQSELVTILQEIEYVWEQPMGRTLTFEYVEQDADITVNLLPTTADISNGQQYDKGDFYKGELNIYEFENKYDLALVLAHEFGHALDMDHVEDSQAIMHYLLQSNPRSYPELTVDDLRELKNKCRLLQ